MIPRCGPVRVEFGAPPSGEGVVPRRAVEVLTVASWLSTAVVVVALLIVQPLLTVAVVAPVALLVHWRAQVAWWRQVAMTARRDHVNNSIPHSSYAPAVCLLHRCSVERCLPFLPSVGTHRSPSP